MKSLIVRYCLYCGIEFKTYPSQIKRGGGKFCSLSCTRTYKNLHDNPAWKPEVREKISKNHADVSGKNNPMYGIKGELAPGYKDGRSKYRGRISRKIGLANFEHKCIICKEDNLDNLHVHHIDGNHPNNNLDNLVILCSHCHLTKAHTCIRDKKGRFLKSKLNKIIKEDNDE